MFTSGRYPVAHNYSGEKYMICKNCIFICELSKSTSSLNQSADKYSYSIKESHDKLFHSISEEGFDKYLEEARREGATIQWDRYNYFAVGDSVMSGSTGHKLCGFCSGCLEIENAELSYGDRTNFVKHGHSIKCVKCGSTLDANLRQALRKSYCPDCGRIINRKKQAEIFNEFENEEKRKKEEEEEKEKEYRRQVREAIRQHKIPFCDDPEKYKHNNDVINYRLHRYGGFSRFSDDCWHEVYPVFGSSFMAKCIKCGEEGYHFEDIRGIR